MAQKKTLEHYKSLATELHDGKYEYDLWTTLGVYHDKITINCKSHGPFSQSLANHITRKAGCPACRIANRAQGFNKHTVDDWLKRAVNVHGDIYDYSAITSYESSILPVPITCKEHGQFMQTFADHVVKQAGCPKCANYKRQHTTELRYGVKHASQRNIPAQTLINLSSSEWLYGQHITQEKTLVEISNELNIQDTTVGRYMKKHNLQIQRYPISTGEREVVTFLKDYIDVEQSNRSKISPRELDVYIPSRQLAIEYCGLYWHGDHHKDPKYHSNKYWAAQQVGIQLITLFEDEWKSNQSVIKSKLLHLIGQSTARGVSARNCDVQLIPTNQKIAFFDLNHVQGDGPSSINIGLIHNNELVACIGFIRKNNGIFILNRYATSCLVRGGFTKLLSFFRRTYKWNTIETFADLRWSTGKLYSNLGFTQAYTIAPDYSWTNGVHRWHKFGFRHIHLPNKLNRYDPALTEDANCRMNGLWKIFDCGKVKFILVNASKTCGG